MIFSTCLVETNVVYAHLKFSIGLGGNNRVGQPPRVVDLPDESSIESLLDFFTDEVFPLNGLLWGFCCTGLASGVLLHRPTIGVDLRMVLNHLPRDPGHL
jgi:hypothetical protein